MSRSSKRTGRTDSTRIRKDANVRKSSHGKFTTVFGLEEQRLETTEKNKKNKKN